MPISNVVVASHDRDADGGPSLGAVLIQEWLADGLGLLGTVKGAFDYAVGHEGETRCVAVGAVLSGRS